MIDPPYFASEEIAKIAETILAITGYDDLTRRALLGGLPMQFISSMSSFGANPPLSVLLVDLDRLNKVPRLIDGTIPMQRLLENAILLSGTDAREIIFRDCLHRLVG